MHVCTYVHVREVLLKLTVDGRQIVIFIKLYFKFDNASFVDGSFW